MSALSLSPSRRWRNAPGLLPDVRGSAAIEFGLIGILCLLLIVETFQAGLYFYMSAALERATAQATRQVMTGSVTNGGLTAAQFRTNVLCPQLPSGMSCSNIVSNLQPVPEAVAPNGFYAFVNSAQTAVIVPAMDNTKTSFCPGTTASVVYAQVFYAMPVFSPFWKAVASVTWNGSVVHFINAGAAFKNEPYPSSQQPPC